MHSDDFDRMMDAWAEANMIDFSTAEMAKRSYRNARRRDEADAEQRADKFLRKPFARLMMAEDPVLGMPLLMWGLLVYFVVLAVT